MIDPKYSDITLTNQGKSYALHRIILSKSPYFEKLIDQESHWYEENIQLDFHEEAWEIFIAELYRSSGFVFPEHNQPVVVLLNVIALFDLLQVRDLGLKFESELARLMLRGNLELVEEFTAVPQINEIFVNHLVRKCNFSTIILYLDEYYHDILRRMLSQDDNCSARSLPRGFPRPFPMEFPESLLLSFDEDCRAKHIQILTKCLKESTTLHLDDIWDYLDDYAKDIICSSFKEKIIPPQGNRRNNYSAEVIVKFLQDQSIKLVEYRLSMGLVVDPRTLYHFGLLEHLSLWVQKERTSWVDVKGFFDDYNAIPGDVISWYVEKLPPSRDLYLSLKEKLSKTKYGPFVYQTITASIDKLLQDL